MDRKSPSPLHSPSLTFPSSPHPRSPLHQWCIVSERAVCTAVSSPHTLDILWPAAQIRGVGAKNACDELPEPQGKGVGGGKDKTSPTLPPACTAVRARTWDIHLAFLSNPLPQPPHPPTPLLNTASWQRTRRNIEKKRKRQMRTSHRGWKRLHKKSPWNLKSSSVLVNKRWDVALRSCFWKGVSWCMRMYLFPHRGRKMATWGGKWKGGGLRMRRESAMEGGFLLNPRGCWPVCRY